MHFKTKPIILLNRRELCHAISYNYYCFMLRKFINKITFKLFKKAFLMPTNRTMHAPHRKFSSIFELAANLKHYNYIYQEYMWDMDEFIALREEISKTLFLKTSLDSALDSANLAIYNKIKNTKNACLIHIRRGDFIKAGYTLLDMAYYKRAIEIMQNAIEGVEFFIFGNDREFIREHFGEHNIVSINDECSVHKDFVLMRACKHAILANSTLSMWIGYLCDGVVVYKKDITPMIKPLKGYIGI